MRMRPARSIISSSLLFQVAFSPKLSLPNLWTDWTRVLTRKVSAWTPSAVTIASRDCHMACQRPLTFSGSLSKVGPIVRAIW